MHCTAEVVKKINKKKSSAVALTWLSFHLDSKMWQFAADTWLFLHSHINEDK